MNASFAMAFMCLLALCERLVYWNSIEAILFAINIEFWKSIWFA